MNEDSPQVLEGNQTQHAPFPASIQSHKHPSKTLIESWTLLLPPTIKQIRKQLRDVLQNDRTNGKKICALFMSEVAHQAYKQKPHNYQPNALKTSSFVAKEEQRYAKSAAILIL